ncbi:MAG: AI-2E family transporter, partial [Myxococcales bacterium]|nr:AI-2E family transporter [Myxococcales bacterium]
AEVRKLAHETPRMIATVRDKWVPAVASQLERAVRAYGASEDEEEQASELAENAPAPTSPALLVESRPDGSYAVILPRNGIHIAQEGESRYRVTTARSGRANRRDMVAAINEALRRLTENTQERAFEALQTIQGLVRAVIRSVFALGIILMISAYLLVTSERIFDFFRSLVRPSRRQNFDLLVRRIDRGLSGVVRGQLVIALVNGLLSGIAFYALDLRYWPVLTLVATALSIIPIFGAILSSVPAVVIALQDDVSKAVAVALAIVVIHQLEANVFNPKIMGDAAKLHPVLVVFALLAGEHAFGIAGALLAVPVLSILQSAFLHFREVALGISTPRTLRESQLPPPP